MRAVSPDEVKRLIHACRPTALRDKALIDLMYHSGLRVSEALDLLVFPRIMYQSE